MITALDTDVLLDVLIPDTRFAQASQLRLDEAVAKGALVICEVVYAELASQFPTQGTLDQFLTSTRIRLVSSRQQALFESARAWRLYLERRGKDIQCPRCGTAQEIVCPKCGQPIAPRQHILSDFLVGGHALTQANRLLTRDLGHYASYFPNLVLTAP